MTRIDNPTVRGRRNVVYLLHFDAPYQHARHYLGSAANLSRRLRQHGMNKGARLIEVLNGAGITYHVSRIWVCDTLPEAKTLEARLKRQHGSVKLCPECQGASQ